jgi:bromodomain adjacent to zinc finger domain protein 1A
MSLLRFKNNETVSIDDDDVVDEESLGVSVDQLTAAMADAGNNWERVALRHSEGREGWEDALLGCLKDVRLSCCCYSLHSSWFLNNQHADLEKFPRLRQVLTRLLFAPPHDGDDGTASGSTPSSRATPMVLSVQSKPAERYYALPPKDRIDILAFMCDIAVSSKAIHTHMETSEEQLTALRKEKIEVNRTKKQ